MENIKNTLLHGTYTTGSAIGLFESKLALVKMFIENSRKIIRKKLINIIDMLRK